MQSHECTLFDQHMGEFHHLDCCMFDLVTSDTPGYGVPGVLGDPWRKGFRQNGRATTNMA